MQELPESRTDRVLGTLWSFGWPLLFLCAMTVLSVATQKYSGYMDPHANVAQTAQPSPSTGQ